MQAITYEIYGPPSVLTLQEVGKPLLAKNEVQIKVHAAEITKGDCELRSFNFAVNWFWLPLRLAWGMFKPKRKILGGYFAGEISAVGKEVTDYSVGQKVYGSAGLRMGAYAQYLNLPSSYTIETMPSNISYSEAAAVPLGALNALHFMRKAQIHAGDKVLINGAGGSIGSFAVQIAKIMGAEVTAVDHDIKKQMLLDIGADHFIDYNKDDISQQTQRYDVVFNMVAAASYSDCIKLLNPTGRYLMGNPRLVHMLRSVITPKISDKQVYYAFAGETAEELQTLSKMLENNELKPAIDKVFPMADVQEAHARVENESRVGIVVMTID